MIPTERLNVEFKGDEEIELLREAKSRAVRQGKKVREWVVETIRDRIIRDKDKR